MREEKLDGYKYSLVLYTRSISALSISYRRKLLCRLCKVTIFYCPVPSGSYIPERSSNLTQNFSFIIRLTNAPGCSIQQYSMILVFNPLNTEEFEVTLRLPVYRQSVRLGLNHLRLTTRDLVFQLNLAFIVLTWHPLCLDVFASYIYAWRFVKCTYRTYGVLLKILPFARSPLSVQALQDRSCLSYVSYATTAA
jgi:hypothetical protein